VLAASLLSLGLAAPSLAAAAAPNGGQVLLAQLNRVAPPSQQIEPAPPPRAAPKRRVDCFGVGSVSAGQQIDTNLTGFCTYQPLKALTLTGSVIIYPVSGQQKEWNPDFTFRAAYQLGRRLTLEYGDYNGNRWKRLTADVLLDGTAWLTWQLPQPPKSAGRLLGSLSCSAALGVPLQPKPGDPGMRSSVSCGLSPFRGLSVRASVNLYPDERQQAWDPDFTYSISYQILKRLSVTYSNYSGNRWPWRQREVSARGGGGAFNLSYRVF
jgi:hypothetical protein